MMKTHTYQTMALSKLFLLCDVVELDTIRNIGRPGYAVLKLSGRSEDAEHPTKIIVKLFRFRKRNNAGNQSCHHVVEYGDVAHNG